MPEQMRQLAAIMFTDIVGYTALMGQDEQKAFEILKKNRDIQKPLIEQNSGKWIKELGDGILVSFPTVSDAVNAAVSISKFAMTHESFNCELVFTWVKSFLKTEMCLETVSMLRQGKRH